MCDQGIKFCSKIQSARNRFKLDESIGLVVANPMQLVSSQTDVGSERYFNLFIKSNMQKKGCWLYSPYSLTWQGRTTIRWCVMWWCGSCWLAGVVEWLFDMCPLVANGMLTCGLIHGCHVSLVIWIKLCRWPESTPWPPGRGMTWQEAANWRATL